MRRFACCRRRAKEISFDFAEQEKVTAYNGLECLITNSCSCDDESGLSGMTGTDGCVTADSIDDEASSCSSSKDACASSSFSQCMSSSKQEQEQEQEQEKEDPIIDAWETPQSVHSHGVKGKAPITYNTMKDSEYVEAMKEKFTKLLLGEDVSGGSKGISTALAISKAITNLSATVFGELWKLEPLCEAKKSKWQREMGWLLSPINYMIELVPAKQNGNNGRMLEIMTPKARADVHMNLPALQKLDSMLINVLDSMVDTEFWYAECGSRAEGERHNFGSKQSRKWWLPSPRVPESGLSLSQRKCLGFQAKLVHQVLKAAKSINEQALLQMPIPAAVQDALPKASKASLGEAMYQAIIAESRSVHEILLSLNLRNEHNVLETVNRLEGASFAWKQRLYGETNKRSPWYYVKDNGSKYEKMSLYVERVEALLHLLKTRFPNLSPTFIDVTKVQYNKDIGHSIIEAYSRVIVGVSFSILSRIGDILLEDDLKKPTTPIASLKFDLSSNVYLAGITETPPGQIRRCLLDQMNLVDKTTIASLDYKSKTIMASPGSQSRSRALVSWKGRWY
ncbi:rop guanine nucleotide exchange factor 14-like isoform X2 [Typha angustifolia]|uniref:rop guanine nucleotide exchange factor 14-like isoform X2 n=1 Tax=Typha angustifolia TaxID=59011 RepID=UPI003C2D7777